MSNKLLSAESSGAIAVRRILYITERCVFRLKNEKLELIEVAPGIDIENDILANMDFEPVINAVTTMDHRIFQPRQMNIRPELLTLDIAERIQYDPASNTLRLNFKGLEIKTADDIEIIRQVAEKKCQSHR